MAGMNSRPNSVFQFNETFQVTPEVQKAFKCNGYIILKNVFDKDEIKKLQGALEVAQGQMKVDDWEDGEGGRNQSTLWNNVPDDLVGIVVCSEKMAGTFEKLLGGEVYHYHTKVIMKNAHTGGAYAWHQDYGYWYDYGCMFPNMGTAFVALDKADQSNGCLKILVGSHHLGRIDHNADSGQLGVDLGRVEHVQKLLPLLHVELEAGDVLFFHCNVLHRSEANNSNQRRWAFLAAYNRADNDPIPKYKGHAQYTPLKKVPNSSIKACSSVLDPSTWDFTK